HALVDLRVAHQAFRLLAFFDAVEIGEELPTQHRDALVAGREILMLAVGDGALADPGDEILIHHVRRDPASGARVLDRALPGRDAVLDIRFALLRHAHERPGDAERILVVDRDAPLEILAGIKRVRPQADAADGPERVF